MDLIRRANFFRADRIVTKNTGAVFGQSMVLLGRHAVNIMACKARHFFLAEQDYVAHVLDDVAITRIQLFYPLG